MHRMLKIIESQGYCVTGYRDEVCDRVRGALVVKAQHLTTGACHTVSVLTPGPSGEIEALRQLAEQLGILSIDPL